MKIGLVLSRPPGYSETFFNSKIEGLSNNGHKVILFCKKENTDFNKCDVRWLPSIRPNPIVQGLKTLLVLISLLPYLRRCFKLYELEKQQDSSVVEILKKLYFNAPILKSDIDWLHIGFATLALNRELVAEAIGARLAVSFRGYDIMVYPIKYPNCYRLLWSKVNKVHSISNFLLQEAYKNGLPKTTNYQIITPAISIEKFQRSKINRPLNSNTPLKILTVARLHWIKGLVDTLRALEILKSEGLDFEYTIIGEGQQREELVFELERLNLLNYVSLVGEKTHNQVVELMKATDLYLQFSKSEGFCNAVLESQAMGLITIASKVGGLPENISDNKTGFLVETYSTENLANKIKEVIILPENKKTIIRESAMLRVREEFTLSKQNDEFNRFYIKD